MTPTPKGRLRRERLVAAASETISELGIAGTSVRAVADRASVSAGSVLYHFESIDQLVDAAVQGAIDEFSDRRARMVEGEPDPVLRLRRMLEAGIPETISNDLRIVYEASSMLRERPQFRASVNVLMERQVSLYRTVVEVGTAVGAFRPRMSVHAIAENLVALEDAYDLYLLDPSNRSRGRYLRNAIAFAEIALDCSLEVGTEPLAPAGEPRKDAP